jgi:hypothetical protein
MKRTRVLLSSILLAVALPSIAQASKPIIAVAPVSGVNVHQGYLDASGDVFAGYLRATGAYQAFVVPGEGGRQELTGVDAAALGQSANANAVAVLHITRLGSAATIRLAMYEAGGALSHTDQLKAATPDDMDKVLARLAKGVATGKPAKENADIETVTQHEGRALTKQAANSSWGIKIGMLVPTESAGSVDPVPGLGVFWLYDARSFLAEVDIGFHTGDDAGDFYVGLGGFVPLARTNLTPYVGGNVRWIAAEYGGSGGSGIQLAGGGGLLIGRLSTVQFRADLQYFLNTFEETNYKNDESSVSHGLSFNLGVSF